MAEQIKYIEKVEISKLWGKFDIEWNLHPDVNILGGGNGSGKTTILNDMYEAVKEPFAKELAKKSNHQKDEKIKELVIHFNGKRSVTISDNDYYENLTRPELLIIVLTKKLDVCKVNTIDLPLHNSHAVEMLSNDKVKTDLDWQIYHLQKKYLDYQINLSKRKDKILDTSENPKKDIAKLRWPHLRFLAIINELFGKTDKKINREENEIAFLLDKTKKIETHQLSSGEKVLLIILMTVLIQDQKHSIFFIDEPETSLHIEWQRKLIGFIRELNPNAQLIIATHSPAIIMEGWLDKVFEVSELIVNKEIAQ